MVDCIYIAASKRDTEFTRICVASVRRYYPTTRVELLPGSELDSRLVAELGRYWDVGVTPLEAGRYGWGFVKLEPLFFADGHRFLVLDSDTVMTGPVIERWGTSDAPFLFDEERQSDAEAKRLYYDWDAAVAGGLNVGRPAFVANTGQWFGTAGVLTRADFEPWLEWSMPRRVAHNTIFKQGEQGILNFVLNHGVGSRRFTVDRQRFMHWPATGMTELSVAAIAGNVAPAMVIHWAGLKRHRRSDVLGSDVLDYFEHLYYMGIPNGRVHHAVATVGRVVRGAVNEALDRARVARGRLTGNRGL